MGNVVEFTDDSFEAEVLQSPVPVLVDFWAPHCAPCRQMMPMIEELAADNGDEVKIGKVNVDDCRETARKYGIMSIPTLMIFSGGDEVGAPMQGMQPKARIQDTIDQAKG